MGWQRRQPDAVAGALRDAHATSTAGPAARTPAGTEDAVTREALVEQAQLVFDRTAGL